MLTIQNKDSNYLAKVVRLKECRQHPNADRLLLWNVDGAEVITDNTHYKEGDVCIFFSLETEINHSILRKLNIFEDKTLNENNEIKGYIHKSGRVRAVKLREFLSEGLLIKADVFFETLGIIIDDRLIDEIVNQEFDTVDEFLVCKKYVPFIKEPRNSGTGPKSKGPKLSDWLYEDQFKFHGNTAQLRKNLNTISPHDLITITRKLHGCNFVIANVLTKRKLSWWDRISKWFGAKVEEVEYSKMYSSRTVLKGIENKWGNTDRGYYEEDVFGKAFLDHSKYLPKGFTVYGELVGYAGDSKLIQKNYDYGCKPGEYQLRVFRVSYTNPDGFTMDLGWEQVKRYCEADGLQYVPELFVGKAGDYCQFKGDVDIWRQEFLNKLIDEFLEGDCGYCLHKVPDEGICVNNESKNQILKLKSKRFLFGETQALDNIKEEDYVE